MSLEADRLIARFRREAGLEKKAENYPGWEEKQLPGVGLSFYLSGCAKLQATTGDARFRERIKHAISELDACQKANGDGYLLATRNGKRIFKEIESGNIRWEGGWTLNGEAEPYYAMEKLLSGLRDAYRYAGNATALEIEKRIGDWLDQHMSHLSEQQMDTLMQCEYGGMNWVLSDLYADTGDARYLALSRRWHDKKIEDPLASGQDCLPGKHANTQFPKLCGLAARFPYTGDITDRITAAFFWDRVVNHHTLGLKCPTWCVGGVAILLNGKPQAVTARPGGYASIKRVWQSGDRVELRFPMSLRIETMPDNAHKAAFFVGPILLAAAVDDAVAKEGENSLPPVLVAGDHPLTQALVRSARNSIDFTLTGIARPKDLALSPFFRVHDKPYSIGAKR